MKRDRKRERERARERERERDRQTNGQIDIHTNRQKDQHARVAAGLQALHRPLSSSPKSSRSPVGTSAVESLPGVVAGSGEDTACPVLLSSGLTAFPDPAAAAAIPVSPRESVSSRMNDTSGRENAPTCTHCYRARKTKYLRIIANNSAWSFMLNSISAVVANSPTSYGVDSQHSHVTKCCVESLHGTWIVELA